MALRLLYFGVIVPVGLLARVFRQDPMRRRYEAAAPSYWIARHPPGPDPQELRDPF